MIRFLDSSIEYPPRSTPDIATGAVAFHKRNDRLIWNLEFSILNGNLLPMFGDLYDLVRHTDLSLGHPGWIIVSGAELRGNMY